MNLLRAGLHWLRSAAPDPRLWIVLGVAVGVGGALWLGGAGVARAPDAATQSAVPATATPLAAAAVVSTATAAVLPGTAQPTARPTGYFIILPGATPMPTPVLPEAPPLPESCSAPGK